MLTIVTAMVLALAGVLGVILVNLVEAPERTLAARFNRALPYAGRALVVGLSLGIVFVVTAALNSPAPYAETLLWSVPALALGVIYGRWNCGRSMWTYSTSTTFFGLTAVYAALVLEMLTLMSIYGWANVTQEQVDLGHWFRLFPRGMTIATVTTTFYGTYAGFLLEPNAPPEWFNGKQRDPQAETIHDFNVALLFLALVGLSWMIL